MTDLEITRLCAEAMNIKPVNFGNGDRYVSLEDGGYRKFDPLHDDAQAVALVKQFGLNIGAIEIATRNYIYKLFKLTAKDVFDAESDDLNRAICECVAKMEAAKCA